MDFGICLWDFGFGFEFMDLVDVGVCGILGLGGWVGILW